MENKICPLLASCAASIPSECQGDRCAWYYGDRCAILELAMNSGDIQGIADMLGMKGGIQE